PAAAPAAVPAAVPAATPQAADSHDNYGLVRLLLHTDYGFLLTMLMACLFGAAHALTPGHGKTLVAAYLVGERGTVGHAVVLGLTTTIAHTGSVLILAAVLWSVYGNQVPGTANNVLRFVGGLFVLGIGIWLLLLRLTG